MIFCVIVLVRLFVLNSYVRTFLLVWKLGWIFILLGELRTYLFFLFVDYFKDKDVFKEFVSRINMLGKNKKLIYLDSECWGLMGLNKKREVVYYEDL